MQICCNFDGEGNLGWAFRAEGCSAAKAESLSLAADITDIISPATFAFQQLNQTAFTMSDINGLPVPVGQQLTIYAYPDLDVIGTAKVSSYQVQPCAQCSDFLMTQQGFD